MMNITLQHYLIVSALLFGIGVVGVTTRASLIIILMSIELMLSAANIALVAFARWNLMPQGKVAALFVMALAAAGVAVGLGIIVAAFRNKPSLATEDFKLLKG